MLKKVISGGQTGVDRIALEIAKDCRLETGGTAPKGFLTENGSDYGLRSIFKLVECEIPGYSPRTEKNVEDGDATLLLGNLDSPGTKETIKYIKKHKKKSLDNPTSEQLIQFIIENNVQVLNVAGNRMSKLTIDKIEKITHLLTETFTFFANKKYE